MKITVFYDVLADDGSYMYRHHAMFDFPVWEMCYMCDILEKVYDMEKEKIKIRKIIICRGR